MLKNVSNYQNKVYSSPTKSTPVCCVNDEFGKQLVSTPKKNEVCHNNQVPQVHAYSFLKKNANFFYLPSCLVAMAVAYFFIKNHLYGLMAVPLIIFLDALYAYSGKKYAYNKKTNIEPLHDEPVNRKNIIETIEKRCILRQHISNAKKKIQLLVKDIRGIDKKPNCTFQKNAFTIKFIRCEQDLKFHQKKIKALDIDIKTYLKELKKKGDKHEEYCYVRDALYEHGYGLRASRLNNKYLQSYYKAYVSSLILDDTASGA